MFEIESDRNSFIADAVEECWKTVFEC